jgi:hypothetical protein
MGPLDGEWRVEDSGEVGRGGIPKPARRCRWLNDPTSGNVRKKRHLPGNFRTHGISYQPDVRTACDVPRFSSLSGRLSFYDKAHLNPPCLHGGYFMGARIVSVKPLATQRSGGFERTHPFGRGGVPGRVARADIAPNAWRAARLAATICRACAARLVFATPSRLDTRLLLGGRACRNGEPVFEHALRGFHAGTLE